MARLTDRERDLIQQARRAPSWPSRDEVNAILIAAQRERARVMARLMRQCLTSLFRITGMAATARFAMDQVILPIKRDLLRRRTINELHRLEDRILADIGVARDEVEHLAADLAQAALPPIRLRAGLVARLRSRLRRRAAIRELEALDDRLLADIGLRRRDIRAAVDRQAENRRSAATAPTVEQANYWDSVVSVLRNWEMSRDAARKTPRSDPAVAADRDAEKGNFNRSPNELAERGARRHQAA